MERPELKGYPVGDPMVRILVVDDEEGVRFFLEQTLQRAGYVVVSVSSGEEALDQLRESSFELAILDLNLGGRIDGLRVLEAVRWRWPTMAAIILTGHGSLESAMAAIREGVDLYLLKPIEPADLRQAVQQVLDRQEKCREDQETVSLVEGGPFVLDLKAHAATRDGQALELTPREFTLLAHLVQNLDRAISPVELVQVVGGYKAEDLREARQIIRWYVHRLRRKIESDPSSPHHILTVRGVGYRFIE